ncbi:hypothetical protein RFI_10753, partial [Reticulomyxa filosa]
MSADNEEQKSRDESLPKDFDLKGYVPHSSYVNSLLTDLYQLTMAYAYFVNGAPDQTAVFDLFFRKCPFNGEYTIFAGLDDVLRYLNTFSFTEEQISQLKKNLKQIKKKKKNDRYFCVKKMMCCHGEMYRFWSYLATVNASKLRVYAMREGEVVFPSSPMIRVEGPVAACQLVETTLLNCVNFASLIATNAARMCEAVIGRSKPVQMMEFGLRRAQGPDGAMSASKYAYLGGFDGTSNILAGLTYDIAISGTHAHSFVTTFSSLDQLQFSNDTIRWYDFLTNNNNNLIIIIIIN